MFSGLYTALITPFRDGKIDEEAFERLIERQVEGGVTGVVPAGTTGESPTITQKEHLRIITLAVQFAAGRIQVIAGTGANATAEAVYLTKAAEQIGIDGSMQVTPYYNKPTQEGLYQHFSQIASATPLPIMLYSVPGRSVISIEVETVVRLAKSNENITSIKEAGGVTSRVIALRQALESSFSILCGDDPLTLPFIASGANGLVSVAANLIPQQMAQLVSSCLNDSSELARKRFYDLLPLTHGLMNLAVNPLPIKEACALAGYCTDQFRLPLTNLDPQLKHELKSLLQEQGIL